MTAPPLATPVPPPPSTARRGGSRRWIVVAVLGVVGLLIVGGLVLVAASSAADRLGKTNSQPMDPNNPDGNGTQALARVLATHGVDVEIVRNQKQLLAANRPGTQTTVVVTDNGALNSYTAGMFRQRVRGAARVVLLGAWEATLATLDLPVHSTNAVPGTTAVRADCSVAGIAPSDVMSAGGYGYTPEVGADATTCFRPSSYVVALGADSSWPQVVVASGTQFLNREITAFDNAGVAVRMVGGTSRVLWYIPSRSDLPPSQVKTGTPDIPRAIGPLIALAAAALLAAMVWRGRRFGKLVVEPLPAVVKAIETTQARGRLYHQARDVPRAAAQLRAHTIRRLAKSLGLPLRSDVSLVIDTASSAAGIDPQQLAVLLAGPLPGTDDGLLQFANDLSRLEEKVHRRYD